MAAHKGILVDGHRVDSVVLGRLREKFNFAGPYGDNGWLEDYRPSTATQMSHYERLAAPRDSSRRTGVFRGGR